MPLAEPGEFVMVRRRKVRRKAVICIMLTAGIFGACAFACAKLMIEPNLETIAAVRAEAIVSRSVNLALMKQLENDEQYDFFDIKRGSDGSIEMVRADTYEMNALMAGLSINIQEVFKSLENEKYSVPLGTLLGSKFVSLMGPAVDITIIPMSIASMDFRTEFESQGINQTKYNIYLVLKCRIRALAPFSSREFTSESKVPIAEAVILGDVPGSYVEVPEEDILDVIDE